MATATSSRRGYALGKPLSEHDMENEDRLLKSRRVGTVESCIPSNHRVMAAATSSRKGYALGKPLTEHDMENEDRFLKSRRGGNVGFCILSDHCEMLAPTIFSDGSDESAAAVDMT